MAENSQLNFYWKQISDRAQDLISQVYFSSYIKRLEPVDLLGRKIVLKVNADSVVTGETVANGIMTHLADKLRDAIEKCNIGLTGFRLFVEGSEEFPLMEDDDTDNFQTCPILKDCTFDSFVVGPANKFAYSAAKAVAKDPGVAFNPLFIYGESGLGKTHLMHAIANEINAQSPGRKVLYTTSENFLNEFVASITQKTGVKFRLRYRNVDVLMIDDIQFLKSRTQLQEEFFHIFNELTAQNKQIVLTSDRPPKEISPLEDRLRTRFEGGMTVDIQPPSMETKIAILQRKALDKKCILPDDVLEFLSRNSGHDVRTLEGRLNKVIFASRLHEEPITLELAKMALNEAINENPEPEDVTPDKIINAVCTYFKQTKEDILGKGKKADLAKARQICAYLMCDMLSLPLDFIGKTLGGKDHTTIMYARDKMEKLKQLNERVAKEIDDIKNIVLKQ